VKREVVTLT
jgi:hypothetical protein